MLDSTAVGSRQRFPTEELIEQSRGVVHPYIDQLEYIASSAAQLHLKLPTMDERARVRDSVADYLDRTVAPTGARFALRLAERLRAARQTFTGAYRRCDRKLFTRWDCKAGLPLLCPDDAREESKRLQRRWMPEIERQLELGRHMHYAVFTMPNAAPGDLARAMRQLQRRFNALQRACKRKRSRPFPIVGAVTVMETPLGWRHDWHPHINVILACDGFLDYGRLRSWWHWNVELRKLPGSAEQIGRALREIIKYSVQAVPEKSYAKARAGEHGDVVDAAELDRPAPPAMTEWAPRLWLEYWAAHRRFRRTRTYGCFFRLAKPEREDTSDLVTYALGRRIGGRYVVRAPLLESIPGDKSTTPDPVKRWQRWLRPPPEGRWLIENGERILRDFNRRAA